MCLLYSDMFHRLFFLFQKLEAFVDIKSQAEFLIKYGKTKKHSRKTRQYVSAHRVRPEQYKILGAKVASKSVVTTYK